MKSDNIKAFCSLKSFAIIAGAFLFTVSAIFSTTQARKFDKPHHGSFPYASFEDLCNGVETIKNNDIKVKIGGDIYGDCTIEVDNATLKIVGVTITVDGELRIDDVTEGGAAQLVIKNADITTGDRLRIEGPWDNGVILNYNYFDTGDDLRVRPVGFGDLVFKKNRGQVVDDIRFGDADNEGGLKGDMDVWKNKINLVPGDDPEDPTEFVAQSFSGDINIRSNGFKAVQETEIILIGGGSVDSVVIESSAKTEHAVK